MDGSSRKLYAERMKQSEHRVVARLRTGRQCLVKALAPEAGIPGHLRDSARARHVTHGSQEHVGVGIIECSGDVLGNGLFIVEVVDSVEGIPLR